MPKRVYKVSLQMLSKFAQRKTAKHEKKSSDKLRERSSILISGGHNLEAKQRPSGIRKTLQPIKVFTFTSIN